MYKVVGPDKSILYFYTLSELSARSSDLIHWLDGRVGKQYSYTFSLLACCDAAYDMSRDKIIKSRFHRVPPTLKEFEEEIQNVYGAIIEIKREQLELMEL